MSTMPPPPPGPAPVPPTSVPPAPVAPATPPAPRPVSGPAWKPRVTFVALLGGALTGLGVLVLLQQFAVVYPTLLTTVVVLGVALLVGLVVPSLGRLVAVRRYRRRFHGGG